jgi:zinc transport system permease protein
MIRKGFKKTIFISCAISIFSVVFGIVISYYVNIVPSGMITLTMVSLFLVTVIAKNLKFPMNNIVMNKK